MENEEEFIPKEDINMFIHFDKNEFEKNPEQSILFSITDNEGNLIHDGIDLSKISTESLLVLGNSLISILENVLEPEIDKRSEENFKNTVKDEITSLIKQSGMKEGN